MLRAITIHDGVLRPSLVKGLESFHPSEQQRVSSYYLNLRHPSQADADKDRIALKNTLALQLERIDQLDVRAGVRSALRRDWELVEELATTTIEADATPALACFVASESNYGQAWRLPRRSRDRAFFEQRFVLWPLREILRQSDRFGIILTDKEHGRLFLYFQGRIEEQKSVMDEVPGRIRFPDPVRAWHYMHKHVEEMHHHFEHVAEAGLRFYEQEPFEHLIIGGRRETLPQFENHLHRYLRDRITARWQIEPRVPTAQLLERVRQEEEDLLLRQAQEIWKTIQEERARRGAIGLEEVFKALWQRQVQSLLVDRNVSRTGFRCSVCGRLQVDGGSCSECGGALTQAGDVYEEAVQDAVEQSGLVRYYRDEALGRAEGIAALRRY